MRKMVAALALLSTGGCGGGGGSGGAPVQVAPNNAPVFAGGSLSITENVAIVAGLTASDGDGDALTYSVSGGPDAALFTFNGSQLQFRAAPNFEAPSDANEDNVYQLTVSVSDGKTSTAGAVTVTVLNDREGVAVRRIASIGERWMGGAALENGAVMLLTAHMVQRFDLAAETKTQIVTWDPTDSARGRFLSVATARTAFSNQMLVTARLANGTAGVWVLPTSAGGNPFNSYWNQPILPLAYDNMVEEVGVLVGVCASGNNCVSFGSVGRPADATSERYGSLLELPFNADPYAGASVQLFGNPVLRATGLRLPMALTGGSDPAGGSTFLILDQGDQRFDEINRHLTGITANFGWPFREGTETLATGGGGFVDPEWLMARGTGAKQSAGLTALASYRGPVASLGGRTLVAGKDGRIYSVANAALSNGIVDAAAAVEDRTLDFRPDTGSIDHVVAIVSTPTKTLILDRDGDLFVFG